MLQLINETPFAAERAVLADLDGAELWVVVVKGTWTFSAETGDLQLAEDQVPVCLVDEYVGKPGKSSLMYDCDLTFRKPGTDIILHGHAVAPDGDLVTSLDVSLAVGDLNKTIRVFGDRRWCRSPLGPVPSSPGRFSRIPLVYERAYGGEDPHETDTEQRASDQRNPVGSGFATQAASLIDLPVPNLEAPDDLISNWRSRPRPMGFGPIARNWVPRITYAGTYDERWRRERLPFYPDDFQCEFFLSSPRDQVARPHLRGGEKVCMRNLTSSGLLAFNLPRVTLGFSTLFAGRRVNHPATLGTVILKPDQSQLVLVWHTMLRCPRRHLDIVETLVFQKSRIRGIEQ